MGGSGQGNQGAEGEAGRSQPDQRREQAQPGVHRYLLQPVKTASPCTVTVTGGNGRLAGPDSTFPVCASKWLAWQGQRICPSRTSVTEQPWCVHVEENA